MIGEIISERYKITAPVSESHMYEIFKALEVATGTEVIVKILKEEMAINAERVKRFSEEIRSFAGISHPMVAEILDIDMIENQPYVVTEPFEGQDLHSWIKQSTISFADTVKTIQNLATVLQYAASKEIHQRTIKLSNVLRNKDGKIKVLSFTHPRLRIAGKTKATSSSGLHSDLFFLGTTFYELLAGDSPIRKRGGINELWDMKLEKSLRIRHSELAPEQIDKVIEFIDKTLTRNMKIRFNSHEEFLKALADLAGNIRGKKNYKKSRQLSMASQVVDALNGHMSNVNTSMPAKKTFKKSNPSSAKVAAIDARTTTSSTTSNDTGLIEGNLAVAKNTSENNFQPEAENSARPNLKVIKSDNQVIQDKGEIWSDEEDGHWMKNPLLFMSSCLIIMILLIVFW
ncbi:MAG: serine/threonine protein kinase [Candidatus Rifleibacteriota bacterium]